MEIIHIVLGKANPERMNGVNKVVFQLASKQADFGAVVSVWGITKDLSRNYGSRSFKTELFLKKANPFAIAKELKTAIISKKGKAIFHLHGGWIPIFYTIAVFLFEHKIRFVLTPHGAYNTIAMQRSRWLKNIYFYLFEKKLLERTTYIHCIGKSEVVGLNHIFQNRKSVLVPYGFERPNADFFINTNNSSIIFGFIGRLDIYTKGLDTLIMSFSKFIKKNPNAKLWIVGDSKEKSKLEQLIQSYALSNNVILFGSKFGKEKDELLQKMDVFVHPSRNEGLPTSVIEAASFGKPCIVTDATNIGDLISDSNAGISIKKQSVHQLFDAMESISNLWKQPNEFLICQKNAIKMVQDNFNWAEIVKLFNRKIYQ
jgi:glycosyltransferase involved in cell wall biosynthesis